MKSIIAFLIALILLVSAFSSCDRRSQTPVTEDDSDYGETMEGVLKIAYSKNDALNPYYVESEINLQVSKLVYDGLYTIDSSYKANPCLAASAIVSDNSVNVNLADSFFSDGSPVTSTDVVYSFNKAKSSEYYSSRLSNVTSVSAVTSAMVMFSLDKKDPYVLSCLDFPIIKMDSDEEMPVGSGRYIYARNGDKLYLVVNVKKTGFNPVIKTILLEAVHNTESISSSLVIGGISFFYNNLGSGSFRRIDAKSYDIGLNNLIYIGFNDDDEFFENSLVRCAVSTCLDRDNICRSSFQSHARPSVFPFNPDWYALEVKDENYSSDIDLAKSLIKESGIVPGNREIILLYNKDNEFKSNLAEYVAKQLELIGFFVRLKDYDSEEYIKELKYGVYDLYIGEIKLSNNMDLSPLYSGSASYGIDDESVSASRYYSFINGDCEIMDFVNTFNEDMPFVPVCFRNAVLSFTKSMETAGEGCEADVFYDIDTWRLK